MFVKQTKRQDKRQDKCQLSNMIRMQTSEQLKRLRCLKIQ